MSEGEELLSVTAKTPENTDAHLSELQVIISLSINVQSHLFTQSRLQSCNTDADNNTQGNSAFISAFPG